MNNSSEISGEGSKELVNIIREKNKSRLLNELEAKILEGMDKNLSYSEISKQLEKDNLNHDSEYCKSVGCKILNELSNNLGKKVRKNDYKQVLMRYRQNQASPPEATPTLIKEANKLEQVRRAPLDPHFYIERGNVESLCRDRIIEPGALIRISSAQGMGKTSLLGKVLGYGQQEGYKIAKIDLNLADKNTLTNSNNFLYWFCAQVSDDLADTFASLNLQSEIEKYWQNSTTPKRNCDKYIKFLLSESQCPIVIGIDNIEITFKNFDICEEFFPLLRSWHDNSKQGDKNGKTWKRLRLILVSSTQDYPKLLTNSSPFSVGSSFHLRDFEPSEVKDFAKHYELDEQLGEDEICQVMEFVGGHPKLINQTFISLKYKQTTLEQLITFAATKEGIYSDHLQEIESILQDDFQLKSAYKDVLRANEPVKLDSKVGFKLASMGLVKVFSNGCSSRYDLYRQYFSEHLE